MHLIALIRETFWTPLCTSSAPLEVAPRLSPLPCWYLPRHPRGPSPALNIAVRITPQSAGLLIYS